MRISLWVLYLFYNLLWLWSHRSLDLHGIFLAQIRAPCRRSTWPKRGIYRGHRRTQCSLLYKTYSSSRFYELKKQDSAWPGKIILLHDCIFCHFSIIHAVKANLSDGCGVILWFTDIWLGSFNVSLWRYVLITLRILSNNEIGPHETSL